MVFRHLIRFRPNIVAGQIDVLPPERGQVGEELRRDRLDGTQRGDGAIEIPSVPENDRKRSVERTLRDARMV